MPDEVEFTDEQLARINVIHNAAYELCRVLADKADLEWDMAYIGEIADFAAELLAERGIRVRYPAMITDDEGNVTIEEYYE